MIQKVEEQIDSKRNMVFNKKNGFQTKPLFLCNLGPGLFLHKNKPGPNLTKEEKNAYKKTAVFKKMSAKTRIVFFVGVLALWATLAGVCYYLTMLAMTALFFGGQYQGMGVSAIIVLAVCVVIAFLPLKNSQARGKRKKVYR